MLSDAQIRKLAVWLRPYGLLVNIAFVAAYLTASLKSLLVDNDT